MNGRGRRDSNESTDRAQPSHTSRHQDLTYCINDRVELLHQVFKILKPKEIQAMVPDSVAHLPPVDLQELCLEQLLGMSSKRLSSILDGTEPPSDTASSSDSTDNRAISLDSISSDEAAFSIKSESEKSKKGSKGKHKSKKKHKVKGKSKKTKNSPKGSGDEKSRTAERAGLTVLELLELQARARAIRAQLQVEQELKKREGDDAAIQNAPSRDNDDDDDVLIKEEPTEVVELLSSDDEKKPDVEKLKEVTKVENSSEAMASPTIESTQIPTQKNDLKIRKKSDLIVIVPKPQTAQKIKLKRNKATASLDSNKSKGSDNSNITIRQSTESKDTHSTKTPRIATADTSFPNSSINNNHPPSDKSKERKKRRKVKKHNIDVSDDDEIKLQLSDSEKMDLLEDNCTTKSSEDYTTNSSDETESQTDTVTNNYKQSTLNDAPHNYTSQKKILINEEVTDSEARQEKVEDAQTLDEQIEETDSTSAKQASEYSKQNTVEDANQCQNVGGDEVCSKQQEYNAEILDIQNETQNCDTVQGIAKSEILIQFENDTILNRTTEDKVPKTYNLLEPSQDKQESTSGVNKLASKSDPKGENGPNRSLDLDTEKKSNPVASNESLIQDSNATCDKPASGDQEIPESNALTVLQSKRKKKRKKEKK